MLGPPLAAANGASARAGQGPCPSHPGRLGSPPFPPPGGLVGLRPASEAIPGARPGCCVRRCVGTLPPPVAKLRSCVATLRSLRRPRPPPLLSPRPRLAVPLPAGSGFVGSAGRIARPASLFKRSRPWRAGVLPGVPPAPSLAADRGLGFKRRSPLGSRSGGRVRLRWSAAPPSGAAASLAPVPPRGFRRPWLELRGILPWVVTAEDSILPPPSPPLGGH